MPDKLHTHYDNLRVARNAPVEVIRAAYKSLSMLYHPDKNKSRDAARIMVIINAAYDVLSDPEKRRQHDAWIRDQDARRQANAAQQQQQQRAWQAPPPPPQYGNPYPPQQQYRDPFAAPPRWTLRRPFSRPYQQQGWGSGYRGGGVLSWILRAALRHPIIALVLFLSLCSRVPTGQPNFSPFATHPLQQNSSPPTDQTHPQTNTTTPGMF